MSRNTKTGGVLEQMILPALRQGGYQIEQQVHIGERLGGGKHRVDCTAVKSNKNFFISVKWQQSGGTAEQKVTHEIICLAKAVREHRQKNEKVKAYLVLGGLSAEKGKGDWTLRDFYIAGGLNPYLCSVYANLVKIVKIEVFIALANQSKL